MNPLVDDWIEKAEGDFHAAGRELRVRKNPAWHVTCFLSQQCAEKYLKAFLEYHGQEIPKVHHLVDLLKSCKEIDPALEILRADLDQLKQYAVRVRYPGTTVDKDDAKSAYQAGKIVRQAIRQRLGLG
ncbi:MAG: HEPN domain-containing protein [Anaerolineales bacterium]